MFTDEMHQMHQILSIAPVCLLAGSVTSIAPVCLLADAPDTVYQILSIAPVCLLAGSVTRCTSDAVTRCTRCYSPSVFTSRVCDEMHQMSIAPVCLLAGSVTSIDAPDTVYSPSVFTSRVCDAMDTVYSDGSVTRCTRYCL